MSRQGWQETLITSNGVDGTAITNSTVQASIIPASAKFTLPANYLQYVGQQLKFVASGRVSNVVTTPGTLLFQVLFGATAVFNNAANTISLNTTAKTNVTWWLEVCLELRAIGATANFMGVAQWTSESVVGSAAGAASSAFIPGSAPAVGSNFDATVANVIDLQAKFSVNTATTSIQLHQYKLESLN